jgi:hypothetical protein
MYPSARSSQLSVKCTYVYEFILIFKSLHPRNAVMMRQLLRHWCIACKHNIRGAVFVLLYVRSSKIRTSRLTATTLRIGWAKINSVPLGSERMPVNLELQGVSQSLNYFVSIDYSWCIYIKCISSRFMTILDLSPLPEVQNEDRFVFIVKYGSHVEKKLSDNFTHHAYAADSDEMYFRFSQRWILRCDAVEPGRIHLYIRGTYCLHLQGATWLFGDNQLLRNLMSSYQTTRYHV